MREGQHKIIRRTEEFILWLSGKVSQSQRLHAHGLELLGWWRLSVVQCTDSVHGLVGVARVLAAWGRNPALWWPWWVGPCVVACLQSLVEFLHVIWYCEQPQSSNCTCPCGDTSLPKWCCCAYRNHCHASLLHTLGVQKGCTWVSSGSPIRGRCPNCCMKITHVW